MVMNAFYSYNKFTAFWFETAWLYIRFLYTVERDISKRQGTGNMHSL